MLHLRYAVRSLLHRPVLVLTALATIALGVGANSVVFSFIHAVLLRPLPFREPDRLVQLWQTHPTFGNLQVTYLDYTDWKRTKSFESVEAYTFQAVNQVPILGDGPPEQVQATMVSSGLLPMLGTAFVRGRNFTAQEEREQQHVVLISESLWRRKFGSDPNLVGRTIRVGPLGMAVVGVLKQQQAFPVWADMWMPISMMEPGTTQTRRFHPLEVIARLKAGVSVESAQAEMSAIAGANATAYPVTNRTMGAFVVPLLDQVTGSVRPILLIVWMAVGLILLMACANVAHLLLTRTVSRSRELAIRISLGASRLDLAKLLSAESLLLVMAGGGLGAFIAYAVLPQLRDIAQRRIPRVDEIHFDSSVFLYTLMAAVGTAAVIVVPSLFQAFRREVAVLSRRSARPGSMLMISEIALSFVVLGSALLLMRSFTTLLAVNPGYDGRNVLAMSVSLPNTGNGWEDSARLFETQLWPSIRAVPGVEMVATANMAPLTLDRTENSRYASRFAVAGVPHGDGAFPVSQIRWVSEDYFRVLKIPILRGRALTQADRNKPVWVINETLAQQYFPGQDPVGRQLLTGVGTPQPQPVTIVGVVGNTRDLNLDTAPRPTTYSIDTSPRMALLVRTSRDPEALIPQILEIIRKAAPDAPVTSVQTVDALTAASLAPNRLALEMMVGFASIAALLSVIGIYGVVAYSVGRRTREFGVRSAIGARPRDLIRLVAWEGLRISFLGIVGGLVLFSFASRLFRAILYQVSSMDPIALLLTLGLVVLLSIVALAVPARRAARVDPNVALREG